MARDNYSLISLVARGVCGMRFFMAGIWKVFTLTPVGHAEKWFTGPYADTWLPTWALWVAGTVTPFVELLGGAFLLLGLFTRWSALALCLVLIEVTFGHTLKEPLYSLQSHVFVDFVCLVVILWSEPRGNKISLDYFVARRARTQ